MNHVRYVSYWEAYENNQSWFMKESGAVAKTVDKYKLNILLWFSITDPKNGTGFPMSLFKNNPDPIVKVAEENPKIVCKDMMN